MRRRPASGPDGNPRTPVLITKSALPASVSPGFRECSVRLSRHSLFNSSQPWGKPFRRFARAYATAALCISPRVNNAQAVRAFLLARATAATFTCLRSINAAIHRLRLSCLREANRSTARAP